MNVSGDIANRRWFMWENLLIIFTKIRHSLKRLGEFSINSSKERVNSNSTGIKKHMCDQQYVPEKRNAMSHRN